MNPASRQVLECLRAYESRNITFIEPDGSWPVVWEKARGVHVWDAAGRKYLDLTAAFGVAAAGHANPRVVAAGRKQMGRLLHAMGDVHPHAPKARLARELSRLTFERWTARRATGRARGKTVFCSSGFEAVEAALKTALLATARRGVIAFEGGYHGLGYGALNTTHRELFRGPFRSQLGEFGCFVSYPTSEDGLAHCEAGIRRAFRRGKIGAVLVEPVQARGGIRVPPPGFLPLLRKVCDEHGALLVLDEIFTGFGRTGRWFACEHTGVVPDVLCLGKALAGGFPLAACVGRADWMDAAWPASTGEAIHTSTFLGHPVGCMMALSQIAELRQRRLVQHSARLGCWFLERLMDLRGGRLWDVRARGLGLMAGLELCRRDGSAAGPEGFALIKRLLRRGFIVLPEGEQGNVISFTPPLVIAKRELESVLTAVADELRDVTA